jgi:Rps23 Pro-64 3,4-dihydroxylase Tpa1-like proline 4-hydroxylase
MKFYTKKIEIKNTVIPFLLVDNCFDSDDNISICERLSNLIPDMEMPGATGGASSRISGPFKKNKGIFLENHSNVKELLNKFYSNPELVHQIEKVDFLFFKTFMSCEKASVLVSYYGEGDYYLPHADDSKITSITWFYKEPKLFTGGDLYFPDIELIIPPKNGRTLFFYGSLPHGVSKTFVNSNASDSGRFSVTKFHY